LCHTVDHSAAMSSVHDIQSNGGPIPKPEPALNSLPSELRRLIVSHLAPEPDSLHPGCKRHLKSANLAHSCLREWAREYLFRDMALNHVLVGMSSHLECFVANPDNAGVLKYVKHVRVQVRAFCSNQPERDVNLSRSHLGCAGKSAQMIHLAITLRRSPMDVYTRSFGSGGLRI
jgi:hypothetical protein